MQWAEPGERSADALRFIRGAKPTASKGGRAGEAEAKRAHVAAAAARADAISKDKERVSRHQSRVEKLRSHQDLASASLVERGGGGKAPYGVADGRVHALGDGRRAASGKRLSPEREHSSSSGGNSHRRHAATKAVGGSPSGGGSRARRTLPGAASRVGGGGKERERDKDAGRRRKGGGGSGSLLTAFQHLERYDATDGAISLETVAVGEAAADPYDLSRLSASQLDTLLRKLSGSGSAPLSLPPSEETGAASSLAERANTEALITQVRAAMASAPLALLDEACELIVSATAAANSAPPGGHGRANSSSVRKGGRHTGGGSGGSGGSRHERKHGEAREHARSSSAKARDGAAKRAEGGGAAEAAPERHHRSHRRSKERALDRRIEEALNPDRDAVEAKRRARRLERRLAKALRSEGYGSKSPEPRAPRDAVAKGSAATGGALRFLAPSKA